MSRKDTKVGSAVGGIGSLFGVAALAYWLIKPGKISVEQYKPFQNRNIAHRGLHTIDKKVPENSIAAFNAACEGGYGIELDVQLTKDGQVVVFHDDDLKRVCGVEGRVDSKTLEELESCRLEGTDQGIPLFAEVLACVDARTPLIVELKSGSHNEELCEKTLALLKAYKGKYCVESFDPSIVKWFKINAPEIVRGQLAGLPEHYGSKNKVKNFLMGNCLLNFMGRPQFIAYEIGPKPALVQAAIKLGAKSVCYTSHDASNELGNDTVIFEYYVPVCWY